MTNEEYVKSHMNLKQPFYNGASIVLLPGGFKPPHKGHWQMVMDYIEKGEVHIFISRISRFSPDGKIEFDDKQSEKIFNIFAREYNVYDKVITHRCNNPKPSNVSPINSAIGFANYQCVDCDIYIGSTTADEASERVAGWEDMIKRFRPEKHNRIHMLPVAEKIQGARDIRKNLNNLAKDMFPPRLSNEAFEEIKAILNPVNAESKHFVSRFNLLFEEVMNIVRPLVFEHGLAVPGSKPVQLANIDPTIEKMYNELIKSTGVPFTALRKLGSTGRKKVSGDLDLGLDLQEALKNSNMSGIDEIAEKIEENCKKFGYKFVNALGGRFHTLHIGMPIVNQPGEVAQVDIMPTSNFDYTRFHLHSPGDGESQYKGAHRTALLMSLVKICSMKVDENAPDQDKMEYVKSDGRKYPGVQYSYLSLAPEKLKRTVKTFRGQRTPFLANPKTLERSFIEGKSGKEVIQMIFGDLYDESDFNSFETIWNNVIFSKDFPYKDRIDDIVNDYVNRIHTSNIGQLPGHELVIPKEVEDYLAKNK